MIQQESFFFYYSCTGMPVGRRCFHTKYRHHKKNKLSPREQTSQLIIVFLTLVRNARQRVDPIICVSQQQVLFELNCVDVSSHPKRRAESAALQLQVFCQTPRLCFCKSKACASIFSTFFFFLLLEDILILEEFAVFVPPSV